MIHVDTSENFHPYACDGPGKCCHCDRRHMVASSDEGTNHYSHDPATCALCDPEYDHQPNQYRESA
jgi:hypothetical protein